MKIHFNSIEPFVVENRRASAIFQTRQVFKEDVDISPVVIDDHTSYIASYADTTPLKPIDSACIAAEAMLRAVPPLDLVLAYRNIFFCNIRLQDAMTKRSDSKKDERTDEKSAAENSAALRLYIIMCSSKSLARIG